MSSRSDADGDITKRPVTPQPPGVISSHEVYCINEAKARLRWTDSALRAAKRRGLQLLICGKRRYVAGDELIRFFKSL